MKSVHILGIGSPSGDDQAGWLVVDALCECGIGGDIAITLAKLDRPGTSLVTRLEGVGHVILIDAMQGGGAPGDIRQLGRADWSRAAADVSSHGLGVATALTLADALGSLPARVDFYGIEIGAASPGMVASAPVRAAAGALARRLAAELQSGGGARAHDRHRV